MSLSDIAIRRPVFAWMLMAGLIVFGGISFMRMGVSQLPDVDFPVVSVSVTLEGAAPEVMETDIVDVLEDAIMNVQGVTSISSSSRNGSANISIEFELERNIDAALQEVQTKIAQAQRYLPREMDPPIVTKMNPEDQPILWLTVESDKHALKDLMAYVRDQLKDKFTTVPGVGEVFMGGYIDPNLRVWVSSKDLDRYSLSVNDVTATIKNEHSELPAGRIESDRKELNVRTLGEAKSVEEFGNLVINARGGQPNYKPIYLKQVAKIEEGLADIRRMSRANGKPSVGLGIRKQRGSNAVAVAQAVKTRMAEISKVLPAGMALGVNFDATRFIEESVAEINFTLILSALLTALVCWAFLGSWSSTFNVLLAIPTSIIGAFTVLYFAGFTLNTFTLLGLSLAIGIVVDDAIMMLENIVRHLEKGESRMKAALLGAREISFAALAATIAIVAIFLPVAFMKGAIGKFFFQFGVTMSVAVALSLLEALTLTPMRCSQFVGATERTTWLGRGIERLFESSRSLYGRSLAFALDHRWKVILLSLVFFFGSFASVKFLKKEFVPAQDMSLFVLRFQAPVGSSFPYTDSKVREIEKILATIPEISRYFVSIGGMGGGEVNSGMAFVSLKPPSQRTRTQQQLIDHCRRVLNGIPDLKVVVQDMSTRGFSGSGRGFPVEFTVRGPNWEKLAEVSQELMKELGKTGLMTDIDTDYQVGMPEVQIFPDREKAALHAVSVNSIGQTVNALIGGVLLGRYPKDGHRYDIRLRLEGEERDRAEAIKKLYVRNNRGELIPLGKVVRIEERPTLQIVSRRDRERAVSIFANVAAGKSQGDALKAVEDISKRVLPPGYRSVASGSAQTFKESFTSLIFALILGLFVSYMVLASQFNSFIDPVTVLMALPFSISGAFMALLISQQSLNIYSMIGLILLMGIVKKNSILLVDFTNQVMERGTSDVRTALIEACPVRLRPIVMTSFATIAGAVPPALALGPGAESRIPMAVAVIGGVIVSTGLTLYVVPCVYSLFAGLGRKYAHQRLTEELLDEVEMVSVKTRDGL